jgi:hypothetical protein
LRFAGPYLTVLTAASNRFELEAVVDLAALGKGGLRGQVEEKTRSAEISSEKGKSAFTLIISKPSVLYCTIL